MELVKPEIGLIFWMLVTFLIVLFLLRKFAWKPILNMIHSREASIEESLKSAERARDEMKNLHAQNEKLLAEARGERDKILKEAREIKERLLSDAREQAQVESRKILDDARQAIDKEKRAAITELREQVVQMALDAAEKIVKRELKDKSLQEDLIEDYVNEINVN